ncbi:hypothetical protein KJI95_14755 [Shewanella sp. JM162201]|uniref:Energy-coupling factor ABC transporter permease n=1 Tax=Shewanella jiangmenensis TaxID=2837387 RepID=A0ABS5V7Z0_9GAMM|nr:energy-coupling factor ABC transporter permease [Shewanella jiangmenensis]MBT1445771.1 hypothetical protein [Shewanella jiangmenensis]
MLQFWQHAFETVEWQGDGSRLLGLILLLLWLWLIWPSQQLKQLLGQKSVQLRVTLSLAVIMGLWLFNASIHGMLQLHFLGLIVLMLMFSWRLASVLALLPTAFYCLLVLKDPLLVGAYGLMGVCLPLFIAFVVQNRCYYLLPKNPFVLIFVSGFVNAGLSQLTHEGLWGLWLWGSGLVSVDVLWHSYWSLSILMMFPEALLNGMAVTLLLVYRPEWLADYSDRDYLWRS